MALPQRVYTMADACGGTVSRRDLVAVGFSPQTIDWWVRMGWLVRLVRGEYRTPGSGHAEQQRVASML